VAAPAFKAIACIKALIGQSTLSIPVRIDAFYRYRAAIPEIFDYREIAISIPVVEKMEMLFSPEQANRPN